jgi:hypothetical protein
VLQGGASCQALPSSSLPPRPSVVGSLEIDRLWSLLTDEQRQRTLVTLSRIVVQQLDAPPDGQEVRDECS